MGEKVLLRSYVCPAHGDLPKSSSAYRRVCGRSLSESD